MSRQRAPSAHIKLTGLDKRLPSRYVENRNLTEGVVVEADALIPPAGLSSDAKKAWNATVPALLKMRALSETDLVQLDNMFTVYEEVLKAKKAIKKFDKEFSLEDESYIKKRKMLSAWLNEALRSFTKIAGDFGMSPADRTRLPKMEEETHKEEDPLEVIMGGS